MWSQPYIVVGTVCLIGFRCVLNMPFILAGSVTLTCWSSWSRWSWTSSSKLILVLDCPFCYVW